MEKPKDTPVPLSQDDEMKAYRKARWRYLLYVIILAGAISIVLMITLLVFFFGSS